MLHKLWRTKLGIRFFNNLGTFQIKNDYPSTDTRKIENYVLSKNIDFFSFFSEQISQIWIFSFFS